MMLFKCDCCGAIGGDKQATISIVPVPRYGSLIESVFDVCAECMWRVREELTQRSIMKPPTVEAMEAK